MQDMKEEEERKKEEARELRRLQRVCPSIDSIINR